MRRSLILFLVMLVACSSPQYVCSDGSVVNDASLCAAILEEKIEQAVEDAMEETEEPVEEVVEEVEEVVEEPVVDEKSAIDPEVKEIFDKAKDRTKSVEYVYVGPPENLPRDRYYVKGHLIKVEPMKATDHKLSQPYTHVYLNTKSGSATAYCEATDVNRCENGFENLGEVSYNEFYQRTPLGWIKAVNYAEYEGGGQKFENRETVRIKFRTADGSGTMRILKFYGLPAIIMLDNGEEIEFRDMIVNDVVDKDVIEPDWG